MIQQGKASLSPATRLPTLATLRPRGEDFIHPLALIVLVQAAHWATVNPSTNKLDLTKAGQALFGGALQVQDIHEAWERWLKSDLLDELSRIRNIKGQQTHSTHLTKPAERALNSRLLCAHCPLMLR